jgi:hypothetical protein
LDRRNTKTIDIKDFQSFIIDKLIKYMQDIDPEEKLCDNCSGTGCDLCSWKGYRDWIDEIRRPI